MRNPPIIRSDDLRSENRRRLLKTLRKTGPCTPACLGNFTGLSAASISTLASQMIDEGILLTEKHPESKHQTSRGRPRSQLSLNPEAGHAVTVNLTIDLLSVQRVNYAGTVCQTHQQVLDTRSLSIESLQDTICQCIEVVCTENQRDHLHHIGVSFQGMTEQASGTLLWSPIISLKNIPLGEALRHRYGVTCSVSNDCTLISQALSQQHQSLLGDSFATVLFSHGIGLGLYLYGQPFTGIRSSALELGHLRFEHNGALCRCGKRGCIEAYSADYGIERLANGQSLDDMPTGRMPDATLKKLIHQAQLGELSAVQAFTIAGAAIGEGLVTLFTLLDPMPVALVGHTDEVFGLMHSGITRTLQQNLRGNISNRARLHYFNNETPLLNAGLVNTSLDHVDQLFSDPANNINFNT